MDQRKETGRLGEKIAAEYLQNKGWRIIERNWSTRLGELDLIGQDGNWLVFVEVRTTRGKQFGFGFQSVDFRKQQKVRRLALQYLQQNRLGNRAIRFDVVSVLLNEKDEAEEVVHIPNAF